MWRWLADRLIPPDSLCQRVWRRLEIEGLWTDAEWGCIGDDVASAVFLHPVGTDALMAGQNLRTGRPQSANHSGVVHTSTQTGDGAENVTWGPT